MEFFPLYSTAKGSGNLLALSLDGAHESFGCACVHNNRLPVGVDCLGAINGIVDLIGLLGGQIV